MNDIEIDRLRGPVLRSVSRSFYVSLRILPGELRDPLSLGYLLARATDTIADTPALPIELRRDALQNLVRTIQGDLPIEATISIRSSFAPLQENNAERALIDSLPAILEWLELLDERDRREVREVLKRINKGQTSDLARFGPGDEVRALSTAADLDEYTYLVAGCVGEFWTRICFGHVQRFCDRSVAEMLALGMQYGKGLQLINILRDIGSDLRAGRCYLPADELNALGLQPNEILAKPKAIEPILRLWQEKAERGLIAGLDYACAINQRRIRFACSLPALIGARTLALMRKAGPDVFIRTIKITRPEVRKIIFTSVLSLASPSSLRSQFNRLSR